MDPLNFEEPTRFGFKLTAYEHVFLRLEYVKLTHTDPTLARDQLVAKNSCSPALTRLRHSYGTAFD